MLREVRMRVLVEGGKDACMTPPVGLILDFFVISPPCRRSTLPTFSQKRLSGEERSGGDASGGVIGER